MNLMSAKVRALDVSQEAIDVATTNAMQVGAEVEFQLVNILGKPEIIESDIIVSNPPYVRKSEQGLMHTNVLKHEPHLALFVEDEDPLLFYRKITSYARRSLSRGGKLYFEINEAFGKDVADLLNSADFTNVEIMKDLHGKDRIIRGQLAHRS